jgi:hypothetical protein
MANGICGLDQEIEAIAKTPRHDHAAEVREIGAHGH